MTHHRVPRKTALVGGLALAILVLGVVPPGQGRAPVPGKPGPRPASASSPRPVAIEVRFTDDSVLKLLLREEGLTLKTRYGTLVIPLSEVVQIEFASRVHESVPRWLANLSSGEFSVREEASAELLRLAEKAYPALVEAEKSKDAEVAKRVRELLEKIRDTVPEERLDVRKNDVITTMESRISGRIEATEWKATTVQFGDVPLRLAGMRSLRSQLIDEEPDPASVVADPGNLAGYQNQIGKKLFFKVTGAINGGLYGADVYTTDSSLATAAVHAGVLKVGQTGVVRVKMVNPPAAFVGSTQNGVTSSGYGAYPGAYQILKPTALPK